MTDAVRAFESELELLSGVIDAARLLLVVADRNGAVQLVNRAVGRATGLEGTTRHRPIWELAAFPAEAERLRRAFNPFDPETFPRELTFHLARAESSPRAIEWDIHVLQAGQDAKVVFAGLDSTIHGVSHRNDQLLEKERTARVEVELANARLQLLVEGSKRLSPRLNPNAILQALAELVIPALADWSYILHRGWHDGRLITASAHGDPNKEILLKSLGRFQSPASDAPGPSRVFRTGEVALYEDVTPEELASGAEAQVLEELGVRSLLCVPIMGRTGVDAVMTLVSSGDPHRYGREEVLLAQDLAARAGVSLENGRLLFEALDAVRARDEFMAVAAHELRTPLTSLLLQAQLLRQATAHDPPNLAVTGRTVAAVDSQVRRLSNLVDGLLDVSRLGSQQIGLRLQRLDLRALLEEVVSTMTPDFQRAGCRVSVTAPARAMVVWDRGRIEQVLTNLLGNAIKFGAGAPIQVDAEVLGSIAEISVRDHGIGIPKEDQTRIFGRFERAVSTRHFGGLGLGLYISAQILRAHRGSIRVESEPGAGARFVISLPRGLEETAMANDSPTGP